MRKAKHTLKKPRKTFPWKGCLRTAGWLLAVEVLCTMVIGVGPATLTGVGLYNGANAARASLADAVIRPANPGPPPDAEVVEAVNGFGFRLFGKLTAAAPCENVFFSPCSVSTGMAMAWNGAAGHTRASMAEALGLDGIPLDEVNLGYERIGAYLAARNPRIRVANAHGLWVDDQAALLPQFARLLEESYGARAETLDLQAPGAAGRINGWVRAKTKGRIARAVDRLGPADGVVLVDALAFHGTWKSRFSRGNTQSDTFRLADGTEKTVPMMHQKAALGLLEDSEGDFTAVRLPYGDGSMAMYVFVPDEDAGLSAFLKTLTSKRWEGWMGRFREREIKLWLPRFRAEYDADFSDPLASLGLAEAFNRDRTHPADFTAMTGTDAGLYLGRVLHRARLQVDEAGTRAEAVTVKLMVFAGGPPSFRADHPFFCAIRDERTGLILFAGAIYDPEALA